MAPGRDKLTSLPLDADRLIQTQDIVTETALATTSDICPFLDS